MRAVGKLEHWRDGKCVERFALEGQIVEGTRVHWMFPCPIVAQAQDEVRMEFEFKIDEAGR